MLMSPFFIIALNWKQPRCPSTGEWLNKLGYVHVKENTKQ